MEESMTVLLVDDDPVFLEGIRTLFPWESNGFQIVGTAANGEATLLLCHSHQPDIVVTDIRMPVMDGLACSSYIRRVLPEAGIVLLTSYPAFEYAQQAMHLKIHDYLLKNDRNLEEKLFHALKQRRDEILKRRDEKNEQQALQAFLDDKKRILKNNYYNQLRLRGAINEGMPENDIRHLGLRLENRCFAYLHLELNEKPLLDRKLLHDGNLEVARSLRQSLESFLKEEDFQGDLFEAGELEFGLAFHVSANESKDKALVSIIPLAQRMMSFVERSFHFQSTIYVVPAVRSYAHFPDAWTEVERGKSYRFYQGTGRIYSFHDYARQTAQGRDEELQEKWFAALNKLRESREADAEEAANIQKLMKMYQPEPAKLISWTRYWLENTLYRKDLPYIGARPLGGLEQELLTIELYTDLWQWLQYHITKIWHDPLVHMRWGMREAVLYIQHHYRDPISSSTVADHIGLSLSQFCREFKRTTGKSFMDYLHGYRMEKAKAIMLQGNDKIYEIAEQVGIENVGYFSKLFQRYAGMKPSDFQNHKFSS